MGKPMEGYLQHQKLEGFMMILKPCSIIEETFFFRYIIRGCFSISLIFESIILHGQII
jgi:hypothetical protein